MGVGPPAEDNYVEVVQNRSEGECDQELPGGHNIFALNLNGGGSESLSCLLAGDDTSGGEYGGEEDEAWESAKTEEEELANAVN